MNPLFSVHGGSCPCRGSSPAVRTFQRLRLPTPSDTQSLPRPQLNIQSHPSPAGALRISLANRRGGSAGRRARAGPRPTPGLGRLPRAAPLGPLGPGSGSAARGSRSGQGPAPQLPPHGPRGIPAPSRTSQRIPGSHSSGGSFGVARLSWHSAQHPGGPTARHGIPGLPEHPRDPRASCGGSYLRVSSHSCDCCATASWQ